MKTRYTTAAVALAVVGIAGSIFLPHSMHIGASQSTAADGSAAAAAPPNAGGGALAGAKTTTKTGTKASIPQAKDVIAPPSGKYLGISLVNGEPGLAAYNKTVGIAANIQEEFLNFGQDPPIAHIMDAYQRHALTVLSWQPLTPSMAEIGAGQADPYVSGFASEIAQTGLPIGIVFAPEFNGNWEPWGAKGTEHATPAQYVAAWRRVHDLFVAAGATNAVFIWAPNVINPAPKIQLQPYFPGDQFVDWIGMSAYWTGHLGEDSWATLIEPTEKKVLEFTDKPFVITETGAMQGPNKIAWIQAMLTGLGSDPHVLGMIYFNSGTAEGKRANWTFTDDAAALAAWRQGAGRIPLVPVNQ